MKLITDEILDHIGNRQDSAPDAGTYSCRRGRYGGPWWTGSVTGSAATSWHLTLALFGRFTRPFLM